MERKRSAGAITVRQLARNTSEVLDRVREADAPIIITRHGLPVAAIHPLEIDPWRPVARESQISELAEAPIDLEEFDLDEIQKKVLSRVGERFTVGDVGRIGDLHPSDTALVCARLELKGLISLGMMNFSLTKTGRRVAALLREQLGVSDPSAET